MFLVMLQKKPKKIVQEFGINRLQQNYTCIINCSNHISKMLPDFKKQIQFTCFCALFLLKVEYGHKSSSPKIHFRFLETAKMFLFRHSRIQRCRTISRIKRTEKKLLSEEGNYAGKHLSTFSRAATNNNQFQLNLPSLRYLEFYVVQYTDDTPKIRNTIKLNSYLVHLTLESMPHNLFTSQLLIEIKSQQILC